MESRGFPLEQIIGGGKTRVHVEIPNCILATLDEFIDQQGIKSRNGLIVLIITQYLLSIKGGK